MKNLSQVLIRNATIDGERYYREHMAALSASMDMRSNSDIYADDGSRLLSEGALVSPKFFKRLNGSKLLKPLDESLVIEGATSLQDILKDMGSLLKEDKIFSHIGKVADEFNDHSADLGKVQLPAQLMPELTVLKVQLPGLYQHTLRVMLMGLYISNELGLDTDSRNSLLLAALFHDIGELYIDPKIINSDSKLSADERTQIYAHPVIAYMILKEVGLFKADIARAVLEHHERLDGSGYPRGIKGEDISTLASMIGMAEFCVGVCQKHPGEEALSHLRIMMAIQKDRFPPELIGTISRFTGEIDLPQNKENDEVSKDFVLGSLFTINMVLDDWQEMNRQLGEGLLSNPERRLIEMMDKRLLALHQAFTRIGFQSNAMSEFVEMLMADADSLKEVAIIMREIQFQLKSLMLEVRRHWPDDKFEESPYNYLDVCLGHVGSTFFSR